MTMKSLYSLISSLGTIETLQARNMEEALVKLFITDENYLDFHHILYTCLRSQVHYIMEEKDYDKAIDIIEKVLYHAREYDKFDEKEKIYKYTTPIFDMLECDTAKTLRSSTTTLTQDFYEWLEYKCFDPIMLILQSIYIH